MRLWIQSAQKSGGGGSVRYLGVNINSVCVLAGAELQARVGGEGPAGVIFITGLIVVISIGSRRQTHHCGTRVCRETNTMSNIWLSIYYPLIIDFQCFIGASVCSCADATAGGETFDFGSF